MPDETRDVLDTAVRDHLAAALRPDGEVIVGWLVLAATRSHDGDGVVLHDASEAMPRWQVRGLIAEMQAVLDGTADDGGASDGR